MLSRKFLLSVGTLLFGAYIEIMNGGVTDGFVTLALIVNGVYIGGNVAKHHVDAKAKQ